MVEILGIDPGKEGAFVSIKGDKLSYFLMPVKPDGVDVDFDGVQKILKQFKNVTHVFLERAKPLAMGSIHAFNYGRGFSCLEIALHLSGLSWTLVEPQKWAKVMHQGISNDLKPKIKSEIALTRLYPKFKDQVPVSPKAKKLHSGVVEGILIAGYGARQFLSDDFTALPDDF